MFTVRQVCRKYPVNECLSNWKKAYDTIDRHCMWQMPGVYGVGGKLLKAVDSFYGCMACVRLGIDASGFRLMLEWPTYH